MVRFKLLPRAASTAGEPSGQLDQGFTRLHRPLAVLGQSAVVAQPSERSLHTPQPTASATVPYKPCPSRSSSDGAACKLDAGRNICIENDCFRYNSLTA